MGCAVVIKAVMKSFMPPSLAILPSFCRYKNDMPTKMIQRILAVFSFGLCYSHIKAKQQHCVSNEYEGN